MPALRVLCEENGLADVATYVQSGNVVFSSDAEPATLEKRLEKLIAERFGFDVGVIVRTRDELAEVVARNPLGDVAVEPKRYQVSFLASEPAPDLVEALGAAAAPSERLVAIGRELYAWHPEGVARSKLWGRLADAKLGIKATARNWTTVTTLLEMAKDPI
jgi:uncharacterized protein (DUF1697 family)